MPDPESAEETGPERTCIATRTVRPAEEMIRFVLGPDGAVVPDIRRKLPGRGVWVTGDRVRRAGGGAPQGLRAGSSTSRGRGFGARRTGGGGRRAAPRRCAAVARDGQQGGRVVVGSAKVESAILAGRVRVLIHASDGGADGLRKLEQAHFRVAGASGPKSRS